MGDAAPVVGVRGGGEAEGFVEFLEMLLRFDANGHGAEMGFEQFHAARDEFSAVAAAAIGRVEDDAADGGFLEFQACGDEACVARELLAVQPAKVEAVLIEIVDVGIDGVLLDDEHALAQL